MRRLGVGYRKQLAGWIKTWPEEIGCLEITAEHFFDQPEELQSLRQHYPLLLHGLGLSLGTPGKLDKDYLAKFKQVCDFADPLWISEHIAFTRTNDIDLGHLNPINYTAETLSYFTDHVVELMSECEKPVLLENITTHLKVPGSMSEPGFINQLCERAGCGLLLDVTNLYVNSRNHQYDIDQWLGDIDPQYIKQLHIVGFSHEADTWYDSHAENIQQELYDLTRKVIEYSGVESIIIERDNNFPSVAQMQQELRELEQCYAIH